jgi:hypothetical protein
MWQQPELLESARRADEFPPRLASALILRALALFPPVL